MSEAHPPLTSLSAAQFDEMAAVTFDALFITRSGVVLCANPRAARVIGVPDPAALVGQSVVDFVVPEDREAVERAVEDDSEAAYFVSIPNSDGTVRRMEAQGRTIVFEGERSRLAALRDVTALRDLARRVDRHREALRRNAALFRAVFDSAFQFIAVIDPDGLIVEVNEAVQRVSGLATNEIIGLNFAEAGWWHHDATLTPRVAEAITRALGGELVRFDVHVQGGDGVIFPIDFTLKPLLDGDGTPIMVIAEGRDIREQKQIEDDLRRSELHYRTLVEGMDSGVVLHSTDPGLPIRAFNESALSALGLTRDELLGRTAIHADWRLIREDGTPMPDDEVPAAQVARTGAPCIAKVVGVPRPDDTLVWLSVNAAAVVVSGQPESIIVTFTDITAFKEQEAALRESLGLQRELTQRVHGAQEKERTRIARELHDELGQAMTVLRLQVSGLNAMTADAPDSVREGFAEALASIDETAQLVRRLSQDLRPGILDVFGLAAALSWQTERFDTAELCARFTDETDGRDAEWPKPIATAFFRIYQEALTNCARHAHADHVRARLAFADNGDAILTVQDNGRGLQASSDAGSLGFLNMRERVQPWGGTLDVHGPPGEGTRITVSVPAEALAAVE